MPVIAQTPNVMQPFFPTADMAVAPAPRETVTVTAPAATADTDDTGKSFFQDLLDVVNPLEHLPIVSAIYSNLTGDKPNDFTQAAGDMLYGGPIGFISSIGNLIFKDVTGKTVGDTVWSWLTGKGDDTKMASVKSDPSPAHPKPSTDSFSFLRADVDSDRGSKQAPANATPASSTAASSAAPAPQSANEAATTASETPAEASASPRILNPLPMRGAPPAHYSPSENMRAAGVAQMVANRAHLRAPASEGNSPAMEPAAPGQTTTAPTPVASATPPTVSVGADGVPTLNGNGEQALLDALKKNGISGAIGQQALMAYQKTMAMGSSANNASALTSAMTLH